MALKTKLFQHQSDVIVKAKDRPYYAFLWECGTGKTLGMIALIDARKQQNPKYKTLIVCPATLIENHMDEIAKHSDLSAVALVGTKKQRLVKLDRPADVYVINFEGARIITDELTRQKFNFFVADESQNLKGHTTLQSKACFNIAMSCQHRLIMTGSLIMNNPLDVFGQMRILSIDIFGASYYQFRARYCIMGGFMGKQPIKWINMDRFKHKIAEVADIKTKAECLDLPPKLYETVYVDMLPEQSKMYSQLREQFITAYKDQIVTAPVMLTRLMRFSQITAGFYKTVDGKELSYEKNVKHDWVVDWLKETKKKAVIFVRFIHELKALEQRLASEGIRSVAVHGAVEGRIELVKQFNADAELQVFIGQIDTCSSGINLQAAQYCIFLSNNYSYGDREQAESRTHRSGQKAQNCTYIDVVARGTIDVNILKVLKKKESLSDMVMKDLVRMI